MSRKNSAYDYKYMAHDSNKIVHMPTKLLKELYWQNFHKLSLIKSLWHLETALGLTVFQEKEVCRGKCSSPTCIVRKHCRWYHIEWNQEQRTKGISERTELISDQEFSHSQFRKSSWLIQQDFINAMDQGLLYVSFFSEWDNYFRYYLLGPSLYIRSGYG